MKAVSMQNLLKLKKIPWLLKTESLGMLSRGEDEGLSGQKSLFL